MHLNHYTSQAASGLIRSISLAASPIPFPAQITPHMARLSRKASLLWPCRKYRWVFFQHPQGSGVPSSDPLLRILYKAQDLLDTLSAVHPFQSKDEASQSKLP